MSRSAARAGLVGAAVLVAFYALVVGFAGGLEHLGRQTIEDWPWLILIVAGFGTQIGLFAELRRRRRLHADVRAATGGGVGGSAVGMVACCAHHIADLAPIAGLSGAAVFLTDHRTSIMAVGIAINALGVFLAARRLRHVSVAIGR